MGANHSSFTPRPDRMMFHRDNGGTKWVPLFTPSDEAKTWDGAPEEVNAAFGMPSNLEDVSPNDLMYTYIKLEIRGRKERLIPGTGGYQGARGTLARVTFDLGTEDECTRDCWIVRNGE